MKSSTGEHYLALDHVRALAALLVIAWHFTPTVAGARPPLDGTPHPLLFPLSLLNQGHTGVALFMTLSGYLFAKLVNGRPIRYGAFLWNRALRLLPLLLLVLLIEGCRRVYHGASAVGYARVLIEGLYRPTLPNGGWSITVEAHFYLLLPLLLWAARFSPRWLVRAVALAVAARVLLWLWLGQVQGPAYWTLIGRFDQFALGIAFFHWRSRVVGRNRLAAAVFLAFAATYWCFDRAGGFLGTVANPVWIVLPTIEGAAYGLLIAWYDGAASSRPANGPVSRAVAKFGAISYSIYLLNYFFIFDVAAYVQQWVMPLTNRYLELAWAVGFYVAMFVPAWLSYRLVERPLMRFRRPYVLSPGTGTRAADALEPGALITT